MSNIFDVLKQSPQIYQSWALNNIAFLKEINRNEEQEKFYQQMLKELKELEHENIRDACSINSNKELESSK